MTLTLGEVAVSLLVYLISMILIVATSVLYDENENASVMIILAISAYISVSTTLLLRLWGKI